jgi:adenylate cyclase
VAELIAQGPEAHQRWRRALRPNEPFILGREAGLWSTPWDPHVSRRHASLCWSDGQLRVERLPDARNPVFVGGREIGSCSLKPGESFIIGNTTFTVASEQVHWSQDRTRPVEEQTYSSQYLRRVRFQNADQRIDVLSRLPDVISGAVNESELFIRLVNLLLAGVPRASTVAIVAADQSAASTPIHILHWDQRLAPEGEFRPSQRLILEAVRRKQSVLHVWGPDQESLAPQFTLTANADWAFCTPVLGEACRDWGIYVAGKSAPGVGADSADLREDLKFTELVGSMLGSLRQSQMMQRRQAALGAFFSPQVLDALSTEDPEVVLKPRETEVSVLFCDLRGFSRQAERNAGDLLALLDRVSKALGVMTHHILEQGGVFGDFQGDAAMGFWGWPISQPDAIQRACLAALMIRSEFEAAARQPGHPLADFRMGIGLATGRAVAGRIGTVDQVKVTVFGPVVNLASRLEGMTKILQTPILLDEATSRALRERVPPTLARCRRLAVVKPYGMNSAVEISELLPPEQDYPDLADEHIQSYEGALDAFLAGDWSEAIELLHRVPAKDRVKDFLTIFIAQHNRTPPPGWNGIIPLTSKN